MSVTELCWAVTVVVLALVGLWGLVFPASLIRFSRLTSRKIELNWAEQLDKPRFIDRQIYRHHRVAGLLIWAVSVLTLYLLLFPVAGGVENFGGTGGQAVIMGIVTTVAMVSAVCGFCFGTIIMLRPSAIKPLEAWGNRWIEAPEDLLNRDLTGRRLERWVRRHTRVFCALVLVCTALVWVLVFGLDRD